MIFLAETLRIFDPNLNLARLMHPTACASLDELRGCVRADQQVIDLNGWMEIATLPWRYEGLYW